MANHGQSIFKPSKNGQGGQWILASQSKNPSARAQELKVAEDGRRANVGTVQTKKGNHTHTHTYVYA